MLRLNLQLHGGRGANSNRKTAGSSGNSAPAVSSLEAFREDARQLNQAIAGANLANAAEIVYHSMTGKTIRKYWDGGRYGDRPSSLAQRYSSKSGVFEATFQEPIEWRNRR